MPRWPRFVYALFPLVFLALSACPTREEHASAVDAGWDAASADGAAGEVVEADDEVRPVYPLDAGPADPLAERLCKALHDVPEEKRAACCAQKAGVVFTSECVRVVTAALHARAIAIDAALVDACAAALDASLAGCEWAGPFPPELPDACLGIIKGALPVGARCRSSLECAGNARCRGVGPTTIGRCAPPAADGEACGRTADSLASLARQTDLDRAHPECAGWCNRTKCAALVPEGGACALAAACGEGKLCVAGKCARSAPAKAGEACPGGACEKGAVCIGGKCVARKASGQACAMDFECIGGCLKADGGARGVCGKKCDVM